MEWNEFKGNMKVVLGIVISEKIFKVIDENDNRYAEGREALDKCWAWVEDREIGGDDLYEIIDNAECTGISEFSEKEDDLNIAGVWSLLVDTVAYTSWAAYMKENVKYLPQILDGIEEESIIVLIESALETGFISQEEVNIIMKQVLQYFKLVMGNSVDKKEIMKNMEENGIMEIERTRPNGNDMLNEKLQAVKEMNALFGEEINDGAAEKEIQVFLQNISDGNNDKFLEQYVKILKIVNGLEFNGFIIYGIDKYLLDKEPKQAINGFIANNEVWHENEWQKKYIFIGDSSISWYVYDLVTNKFCELDKPGGKVINVFENIELIIIKILEDALQ